ncbi:MAG: 6-carboxytetrahydropterin synthase [Chitinophagaceae bacterium]|nr:6-carboxytetrahydropterin synthase [Chitinophagaceae bacterium]
MASRIKISLKNEMTAYFAFFQITVLTSLSMLSVTKIFRFEMAHALNGYQGPCRFIHGHSYELHVSICPVHTSHEYIPAPGILYDFKELKKLVQETVISRLDHHLVLSAEYMEKEKPQQTEENRFIMDAEPSAENLLLWIRHNLLIILPASIKLHALRLYETKDSYAEWRSE